MSLEARIPEMSEKELENLQANAERIAKGAAKQKAEAERLLPLIAEATGRRAKPQAGRDGREESDAPEGNGRLPRPPHRFAQGRG
jgi:hypothetical protein